MFFSKWCGRKQNARNLQKNGVTVTPIVYLTKSQCSKKSDFDLIVKRIVEHLKEIIDE